MRSLSTISFVLLLILSLSMSSFGQDKPKLSKYLLRIESVENPNGMVSFTAAYFFGDSAKDPLLTTVVEETPFILEFSAQHFLGIFQGKDGKNTIKVSLSTIKSGKPSGFVEGHGVINVLRADGDHLSYGYQARARNPRPRE